MIYIHGLIFSFFCFIPLILHNDEKEHSTFDMIVTVFFIIIGMLILGSLFVYAGVNWYMLLTTWLKGA